MNYISIISVLGQLLQFEGLFLLAPSCVGIYYKEKEIKYLLIVAILSFIIGSAIRLAIKKWNKKRLTIHAKEGFVITAAAWIIMSLVGAIPFTVSGFIPSYTDAVFETASGFTTTGASILTDLESLPKCLLFWRSFTHWIGGMGILVFMLALLPSKADEMNIMKAESPGMSVDKVVPKVRSTALLLYAIYSVMTAVTCILLVIFGMSIFESMCIAFGCAGTGGFGVRGDSCASYSTACNIIITTSMFLFGVNFKLYILIVMKKFKNILECEEVMIYLIIYSLAVGIIVIDMIQSFGSFGEALYQSTFQVASVMTTTGFATTDFNNWHSLSKGVMVAIMFCGACAGSTGGGMKVSRIMLYFKQVKREVSSFVHPRSVKHIRIDKKTVDPETIRQTNVYLMAYFFIFVVSLLFIAHDGYDLETSFTAIVATINNIGPGLGAVGPTGNFAGFSEPSKWVLIFDMIAGRLEIFPMLIMFTPGTWRRK